jgi:hypothetical protein
VAAEVRDKYIEEKEDIVVYIASRFERNEVNIEANTKSDSARKYSRNRNRIKDLIVSKFSDYD